MALATQPMASGKLYLEKLERVCNTGNAALSCYKDLIETPKIMFSVIATALAAIKERMISNTNNFNGTTNHL